ncbi:MAG: hypothetical protein Q6362_012185 [Candidatus Wukongarchaeota archaeon]|nr:hypothetical protein [Candidatus Wukongarchaeota archaeon]
MVYNIVVIVFPVDSDPYAKLFTVSSLVPYLSELVEKKVKFAVYHLSDPFFCYPAK